MALPVRCDVAVRVAADWRVLSGNKAGGAALSIGSRRAAFQTATPVRRSTGASGYRTVIAGTVATHLLTFTNGCG